MRILTLRTVFERETILKLFPDPEFSLRIDSENDHYLGVFVFTAESQEDGNLLLRALSTTVVGVQRYTTKRLSRQGVYVTSEVGGGSLLGQMLRAHYQAAHQDLIERMDSAGGGVPLPWSKRYYSNGAGDLPSPPEFVMSDPELEELEELFNSPETGHEFDSEN